MVTAGVVEKYQKGMVVQEKAKSISCCFYLCVKTCQLLATQFRWCCPEGAQLSRRELGDIVRCVGYGCLPTTRTAQDSNHEVYIGNKQGKSFYILHGLKRWIINPNASVPKSKAGILAVHFSCNQSCAIRNLPCLKSRFPCSAVFLNILRNSGGFCSAVPFTELLPMHQQHFCNSHCSLLWQRCGEKFWCGICLICTSEQTPPGTLLLCFPGMQKKNIHRE